MRKVHKEFKVRRELMVLLDRRVFKEYKAQQVQTELRARKAHKDQSD